MSFFAGLGSTIAIFIMKIEALGVAEIADILEWVFYVILPNFCFGMGLQDIYTNYQNKKICTQYDLDTVCTVLASIPNATNPCCPG